METGFVTPVPTINDSAFEVPTPGVVTVTCAARAKVRSPAGMVAVSWPALRYVVVTAKPSKITCELLLKPLPNTVKVKPAELSAAEFGEREVRTIPPLLTVEVT